MGCFVQEGAEDVGWAAGESFSADEDFGQSFALIVVAGPAGGGEVSEPQ